MSVSTATRLRGSLASSASRIESLIASQILSGCPSVTDSEVNNLRVDSVTTLVTSHQLLCRPPEPSLRDNLSGRSTSAELRHGIPQSGRQLCFRPERDRQFGAVGG